ncbi:MAG: DUF2029 domain-containing protein [Tatlockia sp.]|nr:DUF2029 domain-containing protein [Tatlockia sp.]
MSNRYLTIVFTLIVITSYSLLFYWVLTKTHIQDFTSFYATLLNLVNNKNPYSISYSHFLPLTKKLTANLNPPFVFFVFGFLAKFTYQTALAIWIFLSFILGLIGAGLAFHHAFKEDFLRKNWFILFLIYLALFSTIINISMAQIGLILLFILMLGYHFYLGNRDYIAGFFWGVLIAFKFFPALLFIYVIKQRRMKVFALMSATTILACLIPYFVHGRIIYSQYFSMMSQVLWYGDNWNASIFGYIFRLFIHPQSIKQHLILMQIIYVFLFLISFLWYLKKLGPKALKPVNHQPFCLTLTMMLLMSPFGWLYYFPLLIFPLLLIWNSAYEQINHSVKPMFIFLISLFLINIPQGYLTNNQMNYFFSKILLNSCFFYGLVLLTYLCAKQDRISGENDIDYDEKKQGFIFITLFILMFGLIITAFKFLLDIN